MKIIEVQHHTAESLINKLHNVTMLKAPNVFPYQDVFISLENIRIDNLYPPQRYVLVDELKKVRELKWTLEKHGIDLFNLNGYLKLFIEGMDSPIDLLPPVVEESIEKDGSLIPLINDGMHRLYIAKLEGATPQVIYIRGVLKNLPYYAYPIREGWDKVEIVQDLPSGFLKKWHRIEDYKSLYRNFNSAFDNVGGPRGFFTKEKQM